MVMMNKKSENISQIDIVIAIYFRVFRRQRVYSFLLLKINRKIDGKTSLKF